MMRAICLQEIAFTCGQINGKLKKECSLTIVAQEFRIVNIIISRFGKACQRIDTIVKKVGSDRPKKTKPSYDLCKKKTKTRVITSSSGGTESGQNCSPSA
ncbi:hypothetical protein TNCV_2014921 [Trichonephila clavipes]|nr:hypothetical protein TNCV_2014921 [Trichonephila clavipes]